MAEIPKIPTMPQRPHTDGTTSYHATNKEYYLSSGEDAAEQFFDSNSPLTEQDLDATIEKIFHQVCGEHGKWEFFEIVVPEVKKIYGTNLRKAGMRLLREIDHGASRKPGEIAAYFKNALSASEIEFSKRPREEVRQSVYASITGAIENGRKRFGKDYTVEGIFIYGSFPKMNFTVHSDIDGIWLVNGKERGVYIPEDEEYVDPIDMLENRIEKENGFTVQSNMFVPRVNVMSNDVKIFAAIVKEQFVDAGLPFVFLGLSDAKKSEIEKLIREAKHVDGLPPL